MTTKVFTQDQLSAKNLLNVHVASAIDFIGKARRFSYAKDFFCFMVLTPPR